MGSRLSKVGIAGDNPTIKQVGHDQDIAVAIPVCDFDDGLGEHLGVGFAPRGKELGCGVEDELFGLIGSTERRNRLERLRPCSGCRRSTAWLSP